MSNSQKVPKVVVTDEYEIRVGSYYGSHIDLHRDCIDELVELLQAAKVWANTSAKSYPKPERPARDPITDLDPCDNSHAGDPL